MMNKSKFLDESQVAGVVLTAVAVCLVTAAGVGYVAAGELGAEVQVAQAEAAQCKSKLEDSQRLAKDCKGDLKSTEEMFKSCDAARNRCEDALARLSLCQEQLQNAVNR